MRFNENVRLDTSQVQDRRGGGFSPGAGVAVGGGGLGLVVMVIALLLGVNPFEAGVAPGVSYGPLQDQYAGEAGAPSSIEQECRTGADANRREDCRIVGVVNSVQAYWNDEFARRGARYSMAQTRFFTGGTQTGCGAAS